VDVDRKSLPLTLRVKSPPPSLITAGDSEEAMARISLTGPTQVKRIEFIGGQGDRIGKIVVEADVENSAVLHNQLDILVGRDVLQGIVEQDQQIRQSPDEPCRRNHPEHPVSCDKNGSRGKSLYRRGEQQRMGINCAGQVMHRRKDPRILTTIAGAWIGRID